MSNDKSEVTVERNIYERPDGKWGWRLKVNGKIVATDGNQGYEKEAFCRQMADRVAMGHYKPTKKTITRQK